MAIMFGEVTRIDPLEVTVDQRFAIDADFLIVPENLTRYEIDLRRYQAYTDSSEAVKTTEPALPEEPIVIRKGLEAGDRLILLRMQGGQKYLIFDKVVGS
jgi:hypothetical protein